MFQLLYKYLVLHKKVNLPGLGTLRLERAPAQVNFSNRVFIPPAFTVAFNSGAPVDDKAFYTFISTEQNLEEGEAITGFKEFSYQLKQELDKNKSLELPRLGQLFINEDGLLKFKSLPQLTNFFPVVTTENAPKAIPAEAKPSTAERPTTVVEEVMASTPPEKEKKDSWWVFALILALLAIAAIAYYYYLNGSFQ